jgi:hypothetical protein
MPTKLPRRRVVGGPTLQEPILVVVTEVCPHDGTERKHVCRSLDYAVLMKGRLDGDVLSVEVVSEEVGLEIDKKNVEAAQAVAEAYAGVWYEVPNTFIID